MTTMVRRRDNPTLSAHFCGTDADLQTLRTDLEQQRCFRLEQLRELIVSLPPGEPTETGEAQAAVTLALRSAATVALTDIEEALDRIRDNRYGVCQPCGTPIALPRPQALPMVRWCGPCQKAKEAAADGGLLATRRTRCTQAAPDIVEVWGHGSFPASDPPANW